MRCEYVLQYAANMYRYGLLIRTAMDYEDVLLNVEHYTQLCAANLYYYSLLL